MYNANFTQNDKIIFFIAWKFSEGHGLLVFLGNSNIFMLIKTRVTRVLFLNRIMTGLQVGLTQVYHCVFNFTMQVIYSCLKHNIFKLSVFHILKYHANQCNRKAPILSVLYFSAFNNLQYSCGLGSDFKFCSNKNKTTFIFSVDLLMLFPCMQETMTG